MIRYWFFKFKYEYWFRNKDSGIKEFSEQCLMKMVDKTVSSTTPLLKKRELAISQNNKEKRKLEELRLSPMLDNKTYHSIKSRIRMASWLYPVLLIVEVFLNYISTMILIEGETIWHFVAKWGIAIVLSFATAGTVDEILKNSLKAREQEQNTEKKQVKDEIKITLKSNELSVTLNPKSPVVFLLLIILFLLEFAIWGVAHERALDIEGGGTEKGILYYGFVFLSLAIPLIAGYFGWLKDQFVDPYKNTNEYKAAENGIGRNDKRIIESQRKEEKIFQENRAKYWSLCSEFRDYKRVYNERHKFEQESLDTHFSSNSQTFNEKAITEYEEKIMELKFSTKSEIKYKIYKNEESKNS